MNTIKYFYLLAAVLLTQHRANSQYCQIMGLSDCNTNLNEIGKFIPDEYAPILYINLNFHFFINENDVFDPQNFAQTWDGVTVGQQADHNPLDPNNPLQTVTAESIVDAMLLRINERLAGGNPQMDHPVGNNTPHPAYKFRLRKNSVTFHSWTPNGTYPSVTPTADGIDVIYSNDDTHVLTGQVNFGNGPCGTNYTFEYITGWDFNGDNDNLDPGETGYGQQGIAGLGGEFVKIREVWTSYKYFTSGWCSYQMAFDDFIWANSRQLLHEVMHCYCLPHTMLYNNGTPADDANDYYDDTPSAAELNAYYGFHPQDYNNDLKQDCGACSAGFLCGNNLMDYCNSTIALTPQQLGAVFYNMYVDKLNIIHNDYCSHDGTVTTIATGASPTWEGIRICKGDITVEAGATLTLKGRLWMPEHGKIIVKPGGKFYINGGCIGTLCDGLWEGIEVWGNSLLSQNTTNQGLVQLTNNALIEEARTGIRTIKNTGPTHYSNLDWSKTGGIIRATNSNFKNNLKAIEFMSYHNKNWQNFQINNISYFNNCLFETNDVSHFSGQTVTNAITMWDVIGISIKGCTFDYLVPVQNVDQRGNGIVGALSTFRIQDYLNDRNVFQNLNRAIKTSGPIKGFYPVIDHAQFINNRAGITFLSYTSSVITRNDFNWVEVTTPGVIATHGIYLQECQGYTVEENHFDAAGGVETFGVAINNSGNHVTQIYKNYFTNLHAASMVYNDNRKEELQGSDTGLQWLCNEYGTTGGNNSNTYQIGLWGEEVPGIPSSQAFHQGTNPNVSAGNKFYEDCIPDPNDPNAYPNERELKLQLQIDGSYYDYVHDAPIISEPLCRTPGVGLIATFNPGSSNSCQSHLVNGGGSNHIAEILNAHTIAANLKVVYDGYANNGTGPQLRSIVQDPSKTSIEVRNALMDAAPRVTDDLLLLALKRQPAMEGWHMAQAMLANSPLRSGVMTELSKTDYYPFYKALVLAGQNGGLTTRQLMEMDYAHYYTLQYQKMEELLQIQFDVEEEEEVDWAAVVANMTELNYLLSAKDQAMIEAAKGNWSAAKAQLEACDVDEYDYCEVLEIAFDMQSGLMTETGISTTSVNKLQSIAAEPGHKMRGTAEHLLEFWGLGSYQELLRLPDDNGLRAARIPKLEEVEVKMLGVNPNPANGTIYITYLLPEGWEEASISVYDNTGKIVAQFNASQFNGIIEMNGKELSAGLYTVELIADKIKLDTTKLTVVH